MTTFDPRTVRPTYSGQFPGQQFPGPVPPPPSRPSRKRPLAAKIVAGLVAAGLVVGGAGTWMAFSSSTAEAAVQSTSFAGANPTTNPFGTDAPQVAAVAATGPQSGDTTGLYAATDPASCNNADFLRQLQADPAKLAGFGGVFGLGAGDVPAFVNSLSPVVLRANTAVTDHPYADGTFVAQPAVLAAGTAVLVNSYGEPTVKCFNGNPLTAGASAADAVTVVPTTEVISQYSFTSIDNSRVVVVPGKPDPKPEKGPNPTTTPQPDPELVKKAQEAEATAAKARAEATAAREKANDAKTAATIAATNLTQAEADLARAKAQGANPTVIAALTKVRDDAEIDLQTKQNQAKFADAAATSAEGTATQAEQNAKDAKQKADDSAKVPAEDRDKDRNKDKGQVVQTKVDPTLVGPEGQTPITGQAGSSVPCGAVADSAVATKECTVPSGSADAATGTKPATGTTATGTTGGSTSTGSTSTGTGSGSSSGSGSSGGSSSSGSGSQSPAKGGTDK
jgi:hypothetical protein